MSDGEDLLEVEKNNLLSSSLESLLDEDAGNEAKDVLEDPEVPWDDRNESQ